MCDKIKDYIRETLDIECECEYIECNNEDCSPFYRVTLPSEYRVFKRGLAVELLDNFKNCEITVKCK